MQGHRYTPKKTPIGAEAVEKFGSRTSNLNSKQREKKPSPIPRKFEKTRPRRKTINYCYFYIVAYADE